MRSSIKNKYILLLLCLFMLPLACEDQLDVTNPNNPTPDIVLSEEGLKRQAVGIWDAPGGFWEWVSWSLLEAMGDNLVMPWVNFDWNRFFGNIELIEYSDGSADWSPRIQASPSRSQAEWVSFINDRQITQGGFEAQWLTAYGFNTEANRILQALDEGVALTGDVQAKEDAYRAWAHFWKGYAYSMVGLFYEQGVVNDDPTGTNNDFKSSAEMIAASQAELDLALQTAGSFGIIARDVIPGIFPTNLTSASFIQNIHTLKARNLLMSKRQEDISSAEWQQIKNWAEEGLMVNDGALLFDSDESTHLTSITHRWRLSTNIWHRVSARVIQIMSENSDQRLNRFQFTTGGGSFANRVTQPQINSPWLTLSGSPYASSSPGTPQYILSAEENMLMLAEAELGLGNPGPAAGWVNTVRAMPLQQAGLPDETTVTLQDIRNERKVALFGRAVAFYDARRFGEIDAKSEGGGIFDVWVYHIDANGDLVLDDNANIYFDFLPYYALPDAEADFNIGDNPSPEL